MRKASWLFLVLVALSASSCRKKTWAEFYQLDGQQSVLVARDGEGAYESEDMDRIIAALQAAPENARERDQAVALAAKLTAERDRLKAARAALQNTVVTGTSPTFVPSLPTPRNDPSPTENAPVEDAGTGPSTPQVGMTEAEFVAAFGKCFSSGPAVSTPDNKTAPSQKLNDDPKCRALHAPAEKAETEVLFVFAGGKLSGTRMMDIVDAGMTITKVPPKQTEPIVVDAGTVQYLEVPGMPSQPAPEKK